MSMLRRALAGIPRRIWATAAAPSAMCRPGTEILQAPALPSLHLAAPSIPRPGPAAQMMQTFTSSAAAAAATAARVRGVSNFQGWQHYPVIFKGTKGLKWGGQKRFLSMGRETNKPPLARIGEWIERYFGFRRQAMFVWIFGGSSLVVTTILYIRIDRQCDEIIAGCNSRRYRVVEPREGHLVCKLCGKDK